MPANGRPNRKAQLQPPQQASSRNTRRDETFAGKENSRPDQNGGSRSRNRRSAGGGRRSGAAQDKEPAEQRPVLHDAIDGVLAILNGHGDVPSRIRLAKAFTGNALLLMREDNHLKTRRETRRLIVRIVTVGGVVAGIVIATALVVPDPLDKVFMVVAGTVATVISVAVRHFGGGGRTRSPREQGQQSRTEEFLSKATEAITGESNG